MKIRLAVALSALSLFAVNPAHAVPTPELYPNQYLKKVGPEKARTDMGTCRIEAEEYISSPGKEKSVVREGVGNAAKGAAKGALVGAIMGNAGRGAGAGAALGGVNTVGGRVRDNRNGSPEYRKAVEACLEDKGYKVVGWK